MKHLRFFLLPIVTTLILFFDVKADVPNFDVAEIEINGNNYFLKYESRGFLFNNDFCYYNYKEQYLYEVEDVVKDILDGRYIKIFKELHIIDLKKMSEYFGEGNEKLFVLKNNIPIDSIDFNGDFELINIQKGNTYGYTYSENLAEQDNIWIQENTIEELFGLGGNDDCYRKLYGIKGSVNEFEKRRIKAKLDKLLLASKYEEFRQELIELYDENIIMIGFCSC